MNYLMCLSVKEYVKQIDDNRQKYKQKCTNQESVNIFDYCDNDILVYRCICDEGNNEPYVSSYYFKEKAICIKTHKREEGTYEIYYVRCEEYDNMFSVIYLIISVIVYLYIQILV